MLYRWRIVGWFDSLIGKNLLELIDGSECDSWMCTFGLWTLGSTMVCSNECFDRYGNLAFRSIALYFDYGSISWSLRCPMTSKLLGWSSRSPNIDLFDSWLASSCFDDHDSWQVAFDVRKELNPTLDTDFLVLDSVETCKVLSWKWGMISRMVAWMVDAHIGDGSKWNFGHLECILTDFNLNYVKFSGSIGWRRSADYVCNRILRNWH